MAQPLRLQHEIDPAQEIIAETSGLLSSFKIRPYDVMLVMYQRGLIAGEKRLRSGLFLANNATGTVREDTFQGKVGLVMKVGSLAFTDEDDHKWAGFTPKVGDWVAISVADSQFGFEISPAPGKTEGRKIRIVDENFIRMIVQEPDVIW